VKVTARAICALRIMQTVAMPSRYVVKGWVTAPGSSGAGASRYGEQASSSGAAARRM
jgi:hypothetical protein